MVKFGALKFNFFGRMSG